MSTGPGDAPEVSATNPREEGHPAPVEGGRASSELPESGRPGAPAVPRPGEGRALPEQPEGTAVPSRPVDEAGLALDEAWSWKPWYALAALAAGLLLLSPLVRLRFLGDDFIWVYEAAHQSLPGLFQRGYFEFVRPVNELYWFLMWTVSGTDPRGYHLVTMGLYALTALLLYLWVRELTESPWAGFASLCLFLANPVHAEPVGWPSACSEALAGAFVLAALYAYRRWRLQGEGRWRGATLAALALAFGSKESSIAALPGLLLVELTLAPPGEKPWKRVQALLTMLVPSAIVLLALALSVSPEAGYKTAITGRTFTVWMDLVNRAFLAGEWHDALLRAMPQSADLVVCVALAAALVLTWRRAPAVFLHLAWLPCTLVAYAVFVPDLTVSDRYFYLASMASAGAAGCLLARLRGTQAVVWGVLLAMVVAMGSLQTVRQARWMADNFSLPQPEAQTLPAALARHRAGAPLFVYCPPRAELHPLYACAVLGGLGSAADTALAGHPAGGSLARGLRRHLLGRVLQSLHRLHRGRTPGSAGHGPRRAGSPHKREEPAEGLLPPGHLPWRPGLDGARYDCGGGRDVDHTGPGRAPFRPQSAAVAVCHPGRARGTGGPPGRPGSHVRPALVQRGQPRGPDQHGGGHPAADGAGQGHGLALPGRPPGLVDPRPDHATGTGPVHGAGRGACQLDHRLRLPQAGKGDAPERRQRPGGAQGVAAGGARRAGSEGAVAEREPLGSWFIRRISSGSVSGQGGRGARSLRGC